MDIETLKAMRSDLKEECAERYMMLMPMLVKAHRDRDWETVCNLVMLNAEIMSDGLELVYEHLPDELKFTLPVECYTHNGDSMPVVRKYVKVAKKYMPVEKRIPPEMACLPEIEVYRAGDEPIESAKNRISWTTDIEVARWFRNRAKIRQQPQRHIYKGVIKPKQVIWYTDGRNEREIMQYRSVSDVIEIEGD